MAIGSTIEWTDATWNPVAGCSAVSAGCRNCYAARMALRLSHMPNAIGGKYQGTAVRTVGGLPVFTGAIRLDRESLNLPRSWRTPRTIFVNSMSDVFHEHVPISYIREIFDVMAACSHHVFQVLTKRPERAAVIANELDWPFNVWMGTSVEDSRVLHRVDALRCIPAKIRFLSCEPLIGSLQGIRLDAIDWVIVGGESGPGARPMDRDWAAQLRELCESLGIPFFFKQWGGVNKKRAGRELDGREWNDMPRFSENQVPRGEFANGRAR